MSPDPLPSSIVPPAVIVLSALPGVSSTYFSPSAERGRIASPESTDSGSTVLSSLSSSTAIERSPSRRAVILSTTPTRKPPVRTSLPFTSLAPEGSSAFRS